ncbi:lysine 2,3-aminomutase [Vibrio phage vB_VcorM_GR11A]|nr:lysine 2,3-aminomutase [Vibrio phage vB_VcorM_GR11A]
MSLITTKRVPFQTREELMQYDVENTPWSEVYNRRLKTNHHAALVMKNIPKVREDFYDESDVAITPYLAQLMDHEDPNCPIRLQFIPTELERDIAPHEMGDQLGEHEMEVAGTSITHRYPQRVLFLMNTICAALCRHCTRKRIVLDPDAHIDMKQIRAGVEWLREHKEIEDVLLSGGDPLMFPNSKLDKVLGMIREARPDLKILRIGTRLPVHLPTRIDQELVDILHKHEVTLVNIQVNHPKEITPLFIKHIRMLTRGGIPVGNQSVLWKGVNDDPAILKDLFMTLISHGVRPYYVYTMDPAPGNSHIAVNYRRTLDIIHQLRGWISGPAMPTFILDGVGGLGKMPIQPEYAKVITDEDGNEKLIATNFEGKVADHTFLLNVE